MKKLMLTLAALCLTGMFAATALAVNTTGLYLSGKLVYGYTQFNNVKIPAYGNFKFDENDSAFGGALAVGYDFYKRYNVPVRAELEYSIFSNTEAKKGFYQDFDGSGWVSEKVQQKYNIQTLFVNAYYDFHNSSAFTPYVGAGLGLAFVDTKVKYNIAFSDGYSAGIKSSAKLNTNFAFNLNLGTAYAFTENICLDAGYRFASLGSAKTKSLPFNGISLKTKDIYMHQFYLGARYTF